LHLNGDLATLGLMSNQPFGADDVRPIAGSMRSFLSFAVCRLAARADAPDNAASTA
jgi:hypothetical protein